MLDVLARIAEGVGDFAELFVSIAEAGYGASPRRVEWIRAQNRMAAQDFDKVAKYEQEIKLKYRKLVSALKRDGLVAEREGATGKLFAITKKGMAKLAALRGRKKKMLPPLSYNTSPSDAFTIVSFDVPEQERRKRDWLRAVLDHNGFTCVQKSVWMGKISIPQELLDDIRRLRLATFIEIFQITKRGTLKQIE